MRNPTRADLRVTWGMPVQSCNSSYEVDHCPYPKEYRMPGMPFAVATRNRAWAPPFSHARQEWFRLLEWPANRPSLSRSSSSGASRSPVNGPTSQW
jgi:hypothetical protein